MADSINLQHGAGVLLCVAPGQDGAGGAQESRPQLEGFPCGARAASRAGMRTHREQPSVMV